MIDLTGISSKLLLAAADAPDLANRVGAGAIVEGWGWEYVWTSYAITWTVLAAYGLSLWIRRPRSNETEKVSP